MALQASGPIKYSEIREEFGEPTSTDITNSYSVGWTYWSPQTAWVKSSNGAAGWYNSGVEGAWSQFMIDHAVYPSNTDPLVGTHQGIWRLGGEGMSLLPADTYTLECQCDNVSSFTIDETSLGEIGGSSQTQEWQTIFPMGYVADQNYLQLFQGVFTIFYGGVEIGVLSTIPTQIDNRKYYGGNLVVDNGNTWQNPSYYELRVDELITTITNSHNTSTIFNFTTISESYHYLTCNVTNNTYETPETGVTFDENGNLVSGAGSTNTLIRISIGWDDKKGGNDHGVAWQRYTIPELGIDFSAENAGENITEWGARSKVVQVEPNRTYAATLLRGDGTTTIPWRHNNNQRFCIPDQQGTDANAQIWISAPNKVFPSSSSEITEILNRDRITGSWPNYYYWPSNDGNTENNGEQGLYPDELDEDGNPTGSKIQIRGMVDPDIMARNTSANISGWSDTGVDTVAPGDPNDWNINPAGVAWELKNSSGTVIRRSSDSFNYTYPSINWGTLLQTYSVYPSTTGSLTNVWHEANYLFDTNSSSTYTIEASADSKFQILLVDNDTGNSVDVLSSENNESCNTGSCPISNALAITPNSTHRLRVRVYNASLPNVPANSWLYNPGGIAFTIKDSSGTILKTSRDTGEQGSIQVIGDGSSRFGNYRVSESFGSLVGVPLDTDAGVDLNVDIPRSGPIKFSNFYNARLNMAVDYYNGGTEYRPETGRSRYDDTTKVRVIGGFKAKPDNPTGKKVILHINKLIGVDEVTKVGDYSGQSSKCAFRTGSNWGESGTKIRIDVGSSGQVIGAGGNGGTTPDGTNSRSDPGNPGKSGTGAIGVQHEGTVINVRTGGVVKAGCGGGGGGGNHGTDHKNTPFGNGENATGGGGGGGAGLPPGEGGIAGEGHEGDGGDGADGTISAGGAGGHGSDSGGDDSGADETGVGGIGGEYSTNHTNGLTAGQTGEQIGESGAGGAGGASGGAIRVTTGTTWTFGDEHVTDNVLGTGKGGASESPTGVE